MSRTYRCVAVAFLLAGAVKAQIASIEERPAYDAFVVVHRGRAAEDRTTEVYYVGRANAPDVGSESASVGRAIPGVYASTSFSIQRGSETDLSAVFTAGSGTGSVSLSPDPRSAAHAIERLSRRPMGGRRSRGALVVVGAVGPEPRDDATSADLLLALFERFAALQRPNVELGRVLGSAPARRMLSASDAEGLRVKMRARFDRVSDRRLGDAPDLAPLLSLGDAEAVRRVAASVDSDRYGADEEDRVVVAEAGRPGEFMARRRGFEFWLIEDAIALAYASADDPATRGAAGWALYSFNRNFYFEPLARDVVEGRAILPGDAETRAKRETGLRDGLKRREIGGASMVVAASALGTVALLLLLRRLLGRAIAG